MNDNEEEFNLLAKAAKSTFRFTKLSYAQDNAIVWAWDEIKRLRAGLEIMADLSNELESELSARYTTEILKYPSQKLKYEADMYSVRKARALLTALENKDEG